MTEKDTTYKIIAEYIWIGGDGELRSKARTLLLDSGDSIKLHDHLPNGIMMEVLQNKHREKIRKY